VGPYEYDLILQPDINTRGHTQWFFFSVANTQAGKLYRFNIINLLKEDSLYNLGMLPLMHSEQQMADKVRPCCFSIPPMTFPSSFVDVYHWLQEELSGCTHGDMDALPLLPWGALPAHNTCSELCWCCPASSRCRLVPKLSWLDMLR